MALIFVMLMCVACTKPNEQESSANTQAEQSNDISDTEKEQETDNSEADLIVPEKQQQSDKTEAPVTDEQQPEPVTNARTFDFDMSKPADKAYAEFIKELTDIYGYAVKDIDGDGVFELITTKESDITVYGYNGEIFETGHYDFYTGTFRPLYSEKYPGIIAFTVAGGGANLYQYVTVKDGKLVLEDIWKDYYGYDGVNITIREEIFTNDQKLVSESEYIYNNNQDIHFITVDK